MAPVMSSKTYCINKDRAKASCLVKLKKTFRSEFGSNTKCNRWLILPGIAIVAVILIYFGIDTSYDDAKDLEKTEMKFGNASKSLFYSKRVETCDITLFNVKCIHSHLRDIQNYIHDLDVEKPIKLTITHSQFPNERIAKNWLKDPDIEIESLFISNCSINEIEDYAFDSSIFSHTISLHLKDVNLRNLTSLTFIGLNSLQNLYIDNTAKIFNGTNFLKPFNSLKEFTYISILGCGETNPTKLLNTSKLNHIEIVYLKANNFKDLLEELTFIHYYSLKKLYLVRNQITELNSYAFDSISDTLELLDLRRNHLKFVSDETFWKLLAKPGFTMSMEENLFNCDCKLKSFIRQYDKFREKFSRSLTCFTPERFKDKELNTIGPEKLCTEKLSIQCDKDCKNCTNLHRFKYQTSNVLEINKPNILYDVNVLSSNTVEINLNMEQTDEKLAYVWFNEFAHLKNFDGKTHPGIECGVVENNKFVIDDLNYTVSYTICLFYKNYNEISPLNCQSHTPRALNSNYKKCSRKYSFRYFIAFIVSIVVAPFVGALFVYTALKLYPSLLRGSDRIVVVKNEQNCKKNSVMILPKHPLIKRSSEPALSNITMRPISENYIVSKEFNAYSVPDYVKQELSKPSAPRLNLRSLPTLKSRRASLKKLTVCRSAEYSETTNQNSSCIYSVICKRK